MQILLEYKDHRKLGIEENTKRTQEECEVQ